MIRLGTIEGLPNQLEGSSVSEQVRIWEDDEREKMRLDHERSLGSSHLVVGGGDGRHLDHFKQGDLEKSEREEPSGSRHVEDGGGDSERLDQELESLRQLERERPFGSNHIEDGGDAALPLDHLGLNEGKMVLDQTLGVFRSSSEIDRQ
jgi:hypothetical protein